MSEEAEVVQRESGDELYAVAKKEGVAEQTSVVLLGSFKPFRDDIAKVLNTSRSVERGDDPTQRKVARACRLELRRIRCDVENTRKTAKADALRYGKAVDGMANVLKFLCEPEEERLEAIEQHEARIEAARVAAMVADRTGKLITEGIRPELYNLAVMDDATFESMVSTSRRIKAEKIEAERKADAERIERETVEAAERERMRAENAKLKVEAEAREKAAASERAKADKERKRIEAERAKERAAYDAKLKAEAEAREKAEKQALEAARIEAVRIETQKRQAAEESAKRARALAAPDKEKIASFAKMVAELVVPKMDTEAGKKAALEITEKIVSFKRWIEKIGGEL